MGAQMRVYRQRIRSVQATKKITNAMELIAASRVVKARQRVAASTPYARALTRAVSAVATYSNVDHPLTAEHPEVRRAAMVIITSDRGLAGAYSSNVLKESEKLAEKLRAEGKEVVPYLVGRKAVGFYKFRRRESAATWDGFSDSPSFEEAREIGDRITGDFITGVRRGRRGRGPRRLHPVRLDGDPGARGHPAAAAGGRRGRGDPGTGRGAAAVRVRAGRRAGARRAAAEVRHVAACSTRCCRRRPRSWRPASAR